MGVVFDDVARGSGFGDWNSWSRGEIREFLSWEFIWWFWIKVDFCIRCGG